MLGQAISILHDDGRGDKTLNYKKMSCIGDWMELGFKVTHPWLKGCQGTMEGIVRWFNIKYSVEVVDLSGCQWVHNGGSGFMRATV